MATPVTNMRIPQDTKAKLQIAASEQGYESLTAFMVAAGLAMANNTVQMDTATIKAKLIAKYGDLNGKRYYFSYKNDPSTIKQLLG